MELLPIEVLKLIPITNYKDFSNFRGTCKFIHEITLTWIDKWRQFAFTVNKINDNEPIKDSVEFYLDYYNKIQLSLPEQIKKLSTTEYSQIGQYYQGSYTILIGNGDVVTISGPARSRLFDYINYKFNTNTTEIINNCLIFYQIHYDETTGNVSHSVRIPVSLSTPLNKIKFVQYETFIKAFQRYTYIIR
jgi:hypothetical protein